WSSPMLASHSMTSNNNMCLASSNFCNASNDGLRKDFLQIQHSVASLYALRSPGTIIISADADKSS
ncbi:12637_t:CDS:1, partial [Funneliformis geosporum]